MVQRRRPAPHQPTRYSEELRQQQEDQRRQAGKAGPFGDGVAIAGIVFDTAGDGGSGSLTKRHNLGRVPKGVVVTRLQCAVGIVNLATTWDRDTITLTTGPAPLVTATFDVWVY